MAIKGYYIKPQSEEVVIAALVGALVGVTVTSLLTAGAGGYLPHDMTGLVSAARVALFWLGLLGGSALGTWYGITQEQDTHIKGSLYISDIRRATKALAAIEYKQMSEAQQQHRVPGLVVGGVELSRRTESTHIILVGLTGTGKTTVLDSLERQIAERGDRMIVHDIKGDFTAAHYDPKTCVTLGPWDQRATLWNGTHDIATPAQADAFAARVFDVKNVDPKNRHWYVAAATLLSGAIRSYMAERKPWRWSDIADMWENDHVALVVRAARGNGLVRQNFPNLFNALAKGGEPHITQEEDSIFSTVADDFSWILNYAALDKANPDGQRFSIRDWVMGTAHQQIRTVILNYSANDSAVCEQIFGAILAAVAATLGSSKAPEVGTDAPCNLWLVLDEFAQLGSRAFKAVQSISELGRSKGARLILATQSKDQIDAVLGKDKAAPVLHQQRTRIYLQCNPEAAERISADVGLHEIERIQTTAEAGAVAGKTKTIKQERAIMPGEITGLEVHLHGQDAGVDLILQLGSVLGKLRQPFGPHAEPVAPQALDSEAWQRGTLKYADETTEADGWAGGGASAGDEPGADDADDTYNEDTNE